MASGGAEERFVRGTMQHDRANEVRKLSTALCHGGALLQVLCEALRKLNQVLHAAGRHDVEERDGCSPAAQLHGNLLQHLSHVGLADLPAAASSLHGDCVRQASLRGLEGIGQVEQQLCAKNRATAHLHLQVAQVLCANAVVSARRRKTRKLFGPAATRGARQGA